MSRKNKYKINFFLTFLFLTSNCSKFVFYITHITSQPNHLFLCRHILFSFFFNISKRTSKRFLNKIMKKYLLKINMKFVLATFILIWCPSFKNRFIFNFKTTFFILCFYVNQMNISILNILEIINSYLL